MPDWAAIVFAIAAGFTAAGLVSALNGLFGVAAGPGRPSFGSPGAIAWSLVFCALAGPWLLVEICVPRYLGGHLAPPALAAFGLLCGVWSFCSGVVIVETCLLVSGLAG